MGASPGDRVPTVSPFGRGSGVYFGSTRPGTAGNDGAMRGDSMPAAGLRGGVLR